MNSADETNYIKSLAGLIRDYKTNISLYTSAGYAIYHRLQDLFSSFRNDIVRIDWRIKSLESIEQKARIKQVKSLDEIQDIIGIRVLLNPYADFDKIIQALKENFILVRETTNSDLNKIHKSLRAYHFLIKIDEQTNLVAEVQIKSQFRNDLEIFNHEWSYRQIIFETHSNSHEIKQMLNLLNNNNEVPKSDNVIKQFEEVLSKPNVHEKLDIHPFLDLHSTTLLSQNANTIHSEVQLGIGKEMQVDFLIKKNDAYTLVEIENPNHRICNNNGDFTAALNHAVEQVESWQEWIEDNLPSVQKKYPDMKSPEGVVIIGRSTNLSPKEIDKLKRRNINMRGRLKIMTYDDLIADALAFMKSMETYLKRPL